MNRFDIINRIGDKYRVGNTETENLATLKR